MSYDFQCKMIKMLKFVEIFLSAHILCIYLCASELKQLTILCFNQNKVFATCMCTQLTGDSPACSKVSGREKERKAPVATFAILVLFGGESTECNI